MLKKGLCFIVVIACLLLNSGCGTLQGTYEGMKRDFEAAKRIDDWMQENLW